MLGPLGPCYGPAWICPACLPTCSPRWAGNIKVHTYYFHDTHNSIALLSPGRKSGGRDQHRSKVHKGPRHPAHTVTSFPISSQFFKGDQNICTFLGSSTRYTLRLLIKTCAVACIAYCSRRARVTALPPPILPRMGCAASCPQTMEHTRLDKTLCGSLQAPCKPSSHGSPALGNCAAKRSAPRASTDFNAPGLLQVCLNNMRWWHHPCHLPCLMPYMARSWLNHPPPAAGAARSDVRHFSSCGVLRSAGRTVLRARTACPPPAAAFCQVWCGGRRHGAHARGRYGMHGPADGSSCVRPRRASPSPHPSQLS